MKNSLTQFALMLVTLAAFTFLMGYTRPAPQEAAQYIVVSDYPESKFQAKINQKIGEGWRLQGGISADRGMFLQAMVK